ncbi:MAG: hypothetical protein AB9M60_06055 [Leptothrix sp. (in: b-proteobacteria)]
MNTDTLPHAASTASLASADSRGAASLDCQSGRRHALRGLAAAFAGASLISLPWLSGCSALPKDLLLTEQQMLDALVGRFPVQRRFAEIFDLKLSQPSLKLLPADNRLALGLGVGVQERLLTRREFTGNWAFSSGLKLDLADASVRLADVRTDSLRIEGLPSSVAGPLDVFGGRLIDDLLEGQVLHRFDQRVFDTARQFGLKADSLRVTQAGVVLKLG